MSAHPGPWIRSPTRLHVGAAGPVDEVAHPRRGGVLLDREAAVVGLGEDGVGMPDQEDRLPGAGAAGDEVALVAALAHRLDREAQPRQRLAEDPEGPRHAAGVRAAARLVHEALEQTLGLRAPRARGPDQLGSRG
jgi:hypothetical protein